MPQIFQPRANALTGTILILGLVLIAVAAAVAAVLAYSPYATGVGRIVEQPVPFSHEHHVGGLGLDCRYCHGEAEESPMAGVPATETCMTCHSQIWTNADMLEPVRRSLTENEPLRWVRVHDLPDFVYFDHRAHVNNGVGCESCHGRVDQMPLMAQQHTLLMQWCLDCHRNPEPHLRPRNKVFEMGWQAQDPYLLGRVLAQHYGIASPQRLTDCYLCHR